LTEETEITPQGEITLPAELDISFGEAINNARERRIELYLSQSYRDMYEIQWKAERGNYLPNVALSAEYNKFSQRDEFGIKPDSFGTSYQVMLGLQVPIFTGFGNRAKITQARHQYKRASLNHQDLEDKIELDVRNAYQKLSYAKQNYEAQSLRVDLAERGLKIAETRYENQVGINLEVLDAQLEYKVARLSYLQAVYEMIMAQKGMQKAMGINL
jgi:outer membrane protein TolC